MKQIEEYYYQTVEPYLQGTQKIKIFQIIKAKLDDFVIISK